MKKLAILLGAAVIIGLFGVMTQAQSVTITPQVYSKYLGGNGAIFYDSPVAQIDVFVAWRNGIYADAWKSFGSGFGNENDLSVGWTKQLKHGWYINPELLYIDASPSGDVHNDVVSPRVELGRRFKMTDSLSVAPYARWENYQMRKWLYKTNGGNFFFVGTKFDWSPMQKTTISLNLKVVRDANGAFALTPGWLAQTCLRGEVRVAKRTALVLDVKTSSPLTTHDTRKAEAVAGIGFSYRF